jgi:hypothetical protein
LIDLSAVLGRPLTITIVGGVPGEEYVDVEKIEGDIDVVAFVTIAWVVRMRTSRDGSGPDGYVDMERQMLELKGAEVMRLLQYYAPIAVISAHNLASPAKRAAEVKAAITADFKDQQEHILSESSPPAGMTLSASSLLAARETVLKEHGLEDSRLEAYVFEQQSRLNKTRESFELSKKSLEDRIRAIPVAPDDRPSHYVSKFVPFLRTGRKSP